MTLIKFYVQIFLIVFLLSSCAQGNSKYNGPAGPEGPQGPQGLVGPVPSEGVGFPEDTYLFWEFTGTDEKFGGFTAVTVDLYRQSGSNFNAYDAMTCTFSGSGASTSSTPTSFGPTEIYFPAFRIDLPADPTPIFRINFNDYFGRMGYAQLFGTTCTLSEFYLITIALTCWNDNGISVYEHTLNVECAV